MGRMMPRTPRPGATVMVVPARVTVPAAVRVGTSRLGEIPADNLSYYGVKATVVCRFRGGKAPTRRNLGAASLISFVMVAEV